MISRLEAELRYQELKKFPIHYDANGIWARHYLNDYITEFFHAGNRWEHICDALVKSKNIFSGPILLLACLFFWANRQNEELFREAFKDTPLSQHSQEYKSKYDPKSD